MYGTTINGSIPAMKNIIIPITVNGFCFSITPFISNNTPIKPKIIGNMCVNIKTPDAIIP